MNAKVSEEARQIDQEQYYNNVELSDVIIRYGPLSDRRFYGHRKILASQSLWFRKAFEGQIFKESQDKEITLLGDVPTALEKMFEFVYFHQAYQDRSSKHSTWKQRYWEFSESADNPEARIQDILDLYEAADKYVVPELLKQIPYKFFLRLQDWIDPWCKQDASSSIPVTKEGLFNIIERVYELTGAWSRSELRDMLVGTISGSEPFRTVPGTWNDEEYGYGKLVHWIGDHVEALPQFGRDLFLETIPRPYTPLQERYELEFSAGYGSGNTGGVDVSWW